MAQLKETTVSYKNHKRIIKDESEFVVVPNTHEAIVDRELWFKVKEIEASVSHGKRNKEGEIKPLSGLMYCADCNGKMRQLRTAQKGRISYSFDCGNHKRFGKYFCFSHRNYWRLTQNNGKAESNTKLYIRSKSIRSYK